jgi:VWFA-related protein
MPKLLLVMWLAGIALPASAAKRVTVQELDQLVATAHGKSDAKVAQQLSELELTERVSGVALSRLEAALPGPESRRSLVVLSDVSAFLDPPASEIPATAMPDLAAQRRMMALTVDYVGKTISRLPNFFATRDTVSFEDTPQSYRADMSAIPYQPLHAKGRSNDTVLYRDGREVVDSVSTKSKRDEPAMQGLTTTGVFGPILGTVLVDAAQSGKLAWSHWEQGAVGPQAVFHYVVPKEKSHYQVEYCCVITDNESHVFQQFSGYHGLIAVDPVSGAILRLTLEADLKPSDPLAKSEILVEYSPVEIGGKTYICPVKSVSISIAPALPSNTFESQRYRNTLLDNGRASRDHLQTMLNDVVFAQYHLFRADAHVVTADNREANRNQRASGVVDAGHADPAEAEKPGSPVPAAELAETATAEKTTAVVAEVPATTPTPNPVPKPASPEISVAEATGLPESIPTPRPTLEKGFTLRVTTRLVDMDVVAYDKKGHPVTDLKPEEFEIYDNGRRQEVRFFSQAGGTSGKDSVRTLDQPIFSNRGAAVGDVKPGAKATEGNVTILLIDAGNLVWQDLSNARREMLRFLRTLPADQRVGLYVMRGRGFQVLEEGTVDHALLASELRQWMPTAQDLSRSQQLEQHNRQQFDEVLNPTDLQYVNGNNVSAPDTVYPIDPNLRDNGSNSGRDALPILAGVARHLAAIPGHKNLVWVTSDNVLVDWTDKAVSSDDKGGRHINGTVLRVQEALNDAHASVYPLDASQLETQAIDPSLKNRNIQLAPSVTAPPQPQGGGEAGGRTTAEMQQDVRPIQVAIQDMAEATGGRAFSRSGDIAAELNGVVADARATYLLGFTPDAAADDQYHQLTVKLAGRRGVTLRCRAGYLYSKEPATLKDRFRQAIWQQLDASEIAVSANPVIASAGTTLKLNIATNDLALKQQDDRWVDKLDIFLIQRDDEGLDARITGQTLSLMLKAATHEKLLQEGIPFDQIVRSKQNGGPVRIVVVDENSGRMGSVTVPAAALHNLAKR